eukprot:COSAG02_NODE_1319_length_13272_cov_10.015714_11_plen_126_part_01
MPRAERGGQGEGEGEELLLPPPVPVTAEPAHDPHGCRSRCWCGCELLLVAAVSGLLFWGWEILCDATSPRGGDRTLQRAVDDEVVSALPVVLRVLLITPIAEKVVRWVSGYQSEGMSLFATLLLGG